LHAPEPENIIKVAVQNQLIAMNPRAENIKKTLHVDLTPEENELFENACSVYISLDRKYERYGMHADVRALSESDPEFDPEEYGQYTQAKATVMRLLSKNPNLRKILQEKPEYRGCV
jgi:hypothetical protein